MAAFKIKLVFNQHVWRGMQNRVNARFQNSITRPVHPQQFHSGVFPETDPAVVSARSFSRRQGNAQYRVQRIFGSPFTI